MRQDDTPDPFFGNVHRHDPAQRVELTGTVKVVVELHTRPRLNYTPAFGLPRKRQTEERPMQFTLADDAEVVVTLTPVKDEEGNADPAAPVWTSSNPALVTVTPVESDPSGLSALISGPFPQPLGQAQIAAQGAPGTAPFVLDVTVVPDLAETGFTASFGPATRRTNIAPPAPTPEPGPAPEPAPEPAPAP